VSHVTVHQSGNSGNVTVRTPAGVRVYDDPDEVIANGLDLIKGGEGGRSQGYVSRVGTVVFDSPAQMIEVGREMAAVKPRD
jgi:hypothetical protein